MKGCLTLICDNCFGGAWCHPLGWLTAEYCGFEGEEREDTTSRKLHEPLRRVSIQAASGRAKVTYDGVFTKWFLEAQLDGTSDAAKDAKGPFTLYREYAPQMRLQQGNQIQARPA